VGLLPYIQVNSTQKIIQVGPYKYLRHLAYSASILSLIGIALSFRSFAGVIGTLIIITIVYGYQITIEEKILERNFKETYREYKNKTNRIIPLRIYTLRQHQPAKYALWKSHLSQIQFDQQQS